MIRYVVDVNIQYVTHWRLLEVLIIYLSGVLVLLTGNYTPSSRLLESQSPASYARKKIYEGEARHADSTTHTTQIRLSYIVQYRVYCLFQIRV